MKTATQARLQVVLAAIRENRAYLKTFNGNRLVTGYSHDTGWAITNNGGGQMNQQSYMVCLDAIIIADAPVFEDVRTVKESTFEFNGKQCNAVEHGVERVWKW